MQKTMVEPSQNKFGQVVYRNIQKEYNSMEIFFLVLIALMVFFWLIKKESQKVEQKNLEHIRFLYEKTNQMVGFFEVQKQINDFYKTANEELKNVQQEIKGMHNLHKLLSDELGRLKDMFDVIPMPDGKPHEPNKFVWTWDKFLNEQSPKKPKDHLKVVKLKNKKGKKNDGNNNKNNH